MIKTNGFRVLAMVMTTLWMVTIIPVTVVQAADFRGQGFDLSSYNGTVNWEQVAEADMDFVMIRTGEGRAPDVDTQFAANYDGAVSAGLKVGVYHVCCVRTPKEAVEEAEYCLAEKVNVSNNHISSIETGKQIPSLTTFVKICEQLDTTPDFLLLGSLHTDNLPKNIYDSLALCNKKDLPLIQDIVENFVSKRE